MVSSPSQKVYQRKEMTPKQASERIINCFKRGDKILICGNGGSATMASHMAGEFLGKFEIKRKPLPAISLFDLAGMTAIANDMGYEYIFSRPIEALGKPGDILICLSTSGKSANINIGKIKALEKGLEVIDVPRIGWSSNLSTASIQEKQLNWIHQVCRETERAFI